MPIEYEYTPDLSIADAARRLKVSRKTIDRMIHDGRFPNFYRVDPDNPKSARRIPERDIIAIEQQRQRQED
jgi:excisionase family DNA binding protein